MQKEDHIKYRNRAFACSNRSLKNAFCITSHTFAYAWFFSDKPVSNPSWRVHMPSALKTCLNFKGTMPSESDTRNATEQRKWHIYLCGGNLPMLTFAWAEYDPWPHHESVCGLFDRQMYYNMLGIWQYVITQPDSNSLMRSPNADGEANDLRP